MRSSLLLNAELKMALMSRSEQCFLREADASAAVAGMSAEADVVEFAGIGDFHRQREQTDQSFPWGAHNQFHVQSC
jgi:hypothetical protein